MADASRIMESWRSAVPGGRSDGGVAERALARARAAMAAVDSAEVGTPSPLVRARATGGKRGQPVAASPSRLSAVAEALGQQQQRAPTPVALIDSIRATQMELSALSDGNASWAATAQLLQQEPAFVTQPAVGELLERQLSLQMRLDSAALQFVTPSPVGLRPTLQPGHRSSGGSAIFCRVDVAPEPEPELEPEPEPELEPEPERQPMGDADSPIVVTEGVAPRGLDGTAALRRWQRWLRHLQRRIEARLLRSVVHAWRVCTATHSARRGGILHAVEQQRSRSIAVVKRQALQQWRAAEQQQALRHRHGASVAKRRQFQARKRLLWGVVLSWRHAASSSAMHRQVSLFQAMQSAAEESSAAERSLRIVVEAELQQLGEQLAESQLELAQQLAPERERSEALRERVRLLEAASETFDERQEQAATLLREALAARQDAVLEKSAALARASSSREAELARAAELKSAKRALLVATRTLEACETHGLVRRAPGGAIEVCEIPVATAAPEPSSRGQAPCGLLPKAAQAVADDDGSGDEHSEH